MRALPATDMRTSTVCLAAMAALGIWHLSSGLYIHTKAWLAQRLIASAWSDTLNGERHVKPWPWADTWPVARLRVARSDVDLYVLADASGRTLAFGPGHMNGTAPLGSSGAAMIAGHRDTHFRFLHALPPNAIFILELPDGRTQHYRLTDTHVFDVRTEHLALDPLQPTLTLLTCYPFDAIVPGGPLRYAAVAQSIE